MTNHWIDLRNSDCILIMGSNAAENHPISFKWVTKAQDKGATLISVDPRFTRTSSKADIYASLRSGTDIAFLGGMINYIIDRKRYFPEYVINYTQAPLILSEKFNFADGLFSGYDAAGRKYDKATWSFELDDKGLPKRDETLAHPRCVFQQLKKHYSRYTLDKVSAITGTPVNDLLKVYDAYSRTGQMDKSGTIMYAMGWTQHTVGVQNIRTMSIIQLLLGNMGMAGGGVNALRGESNVQGSTDQGLLFHILPGYLPTPNTGLPNLAEYNDKTTPKTKDPMSVNWWSNRPKYLVSLLKALYGQAATRDNEFGYQWLPKIDAGKPYSWLDIFDEMYKGNFKGFFAWGQNPACSGANSNKTRAALAKLDWMVNVNLFDNETGSFWKGPGMDPKKIKTEVFFLPCAASVEKEGSLSNSGRWMQWRYKAAEPPGQCLPDGDIAVKLWEKIVALYKKEGGAFPEPIFNLRWDYVHGGHFDPHAVAKLINGYWEEDKTIGDKTYKKGEPVAAFAMLQSDGSTSSGNWIYCQSYGAKNLAARRGKSDPTGLGLYPEWSWAWPVNRRIIYNRASVDPYGRPLAADKNILEWKDGKWVGDVPDGPAPPMALKGGKLPFIMRADGLGAIFGAGLNDGPFPEHYEPLECPVEKNPFSSQRINPVAPVFQGEADAHFTCDPRYPFVCTTYRVTEHWQTGLMTRWQPWLLECQPQNFVEMSLELAKLKGVKNGDKVLVSSARGQVECVAMVTGRFKPFQVQGQTVHEVGMTWHFGWIHPKDGGDSANLLTPSTGDPNTRIPESKAFMVNLVKKGGK